MAQAEEVVLKVKSDIGDVVKDTKELKNEAADAAGEFKVMGVSLNGVKKGFASAGKSAKLMFGSIKAGLISTGIGAFVVLIGSLLTFFTKTKKGAELLEVAFAGIGAAISVITDRVSKFGGAIVKLFQGNVKGALTDVKGAFTGIGTEIANDTKNAIALKQAFIELRDAERALNVETAQRRADIEELKLIAEDVTKSEEERLAAAEKAFGIETDLLERRIANAEEAVRIQKEQNEVNESMDEDLDALAEKEIALADIRGESVTKQIELNNKINAIKQTTIDKNNAIKEQNEAEVAQTQTTLERLEDLRQENDNARELQQLIRKQKRETEAAKEIEDEELKLQELSNLRDIHLEEYLALMDKQTNIKVAANKVIVKDDKAKLDAEIAMANLGLQTIADAAGEGTAIAKAAAIAQATISGVQGVQNAFTSANANIGATAGTFGAYPVTMAALAGTFAAMNIAKIASGGKPGAGGGGGGGGVAAATPAPQMMSGAFDISGGVAPDPLQAFVLTDEMTNSQNQLANIRRRATI